MSTRFGPAGRGDSFETLGYRQMPQVAEYLAHFGLTAYEYQCGRGVKVNQASLEELGRLGAEQGIQFSLHAPYYISMASEEEEKRQNSLRYLEESAQALAMLGGNRIIFHAGTYGKQPPKQALAKTADMLAQARQMLDDKGYAHMHLCPEVMGKYSQIGDLEDIIWLCKADKRHIPCVDFGHLNCRRQGEMKTAQDFAQAVDAIGEGLDAERARTFHVHFSKIEYTAAGEKRHLTFEDTQYGPRFEPFVQTIVDKNLSLVVICESRGTQSEDAQSMLKHYKELKHKAL